MGDIPNCPNCPKADKKYNIQGASGWVLKKECSIQAGPHDRTHPETRYFYWVKSNADVPPEKGWELTKAYSETKNGKWLQSIGGKEPKLKFIDPVCPTCNSDQRSERRPVCRDSFRLAEDCPNPGPAQGKPRRHTKTCCTKGKDKEGKY